MTDFKSSCLPYSNTGRFKKIVIDYIEQEKALQSFYTHAVNLEGIKAAIEARQAFSTNRQVLVDHLMKQYGERAADLVKSNIEALSQKNTFTVCTAHQPNIFTGPLYFIYKIFHTIKLAEKLKMEFPENNFVPIFYVGSEDADLEELNHIFIEGERYTWQTNQTGAVGKMKVDKGLISLLHQIEGRLSVEPYGAEVCNLLKRCYSLDKTIGEATFHFVHELFHNYGLVVLLAESISLKKTMHSIFEEELFQHTSSEIVTNTSTQLSKHYKIQANPREINLFYLTENQRSRILQTMDGFEIQDRQIFFTKEEMRTELEMHPERFSPNVILRGLYQEVILPDVAWIGGGGELAYWLQLKDLFAHYRVPFPTLVLRNSFLFIEKRFQKTIKKNQLSIEDLFLSQDEILKKIVERESPNEIELDDLIDQIKNVYSSVIQRAQAIDPTLVTHAKALEHRALEKLQGMQKKLLRAEKRKFSDAERQINYLLNHLFPQNGLQERKENFLLFYAKWGASFFEALYQHSEDLAQQFCVMEEL